MCEFISGLSILLNWSMCLFLCQCYNILVTIDLQYSLVGILVDSCLSTIIISKIISDSLLSWLRLVSDRALSRSSKTKVNLQFLIVFGFCSMLCYFYTLALHDSFFKLQAHIILTFGNPSAGKRISFFGSPSNKFKDLPWLDNSDLLPHQSKGYNALIGQD